jgi:hypothetical protein
VGKPFRGQNLKPGIFLPVGPIGKNDFVRLFRIPTFEVMPCVDFKVVSCHVWIDAYAFAQVFILLENLNLSSG